MGSAGGIGRVAAWMLPMVPALSIAAYWILSIADGESLQVAATYRYGDYNYFPALAGLAKFTLRESLVFEHLGEGVRSFPLPPLLVHGLLLGVLGPVGFIVADVAVALAAWFAARRLFLACGLSSPVAVILTLVVSCGLLGFPSSHLQDLFGGPSPLRLWGLRVPRPFLTDLFLMLCVGSWLRIFVWRLDSLREWAGFGLWFGLLLQSRFYAAATVGLAVGLAAPFLALRSGGVARATRAVATFAAVTAVTCLPFAIQRLFEHPDVPIRFGAFAVDRLQPLLLHGSAHQLVAPTLLAIAAALLGHWTAVRSKRERAFATLGVAAMLALSVVALPVSSVLLGQTIQPYQFISEALTFKTLVLVIGVGQLVDVGAERIASRLGRPPAWLGRAGLAAVAGACLLLGASLHRPWIQEERHLRYDFGTYRVPGYRDAFRALTEELGREPYREVRVLATLDIQVLDWWSLFGGLYAFAPEPCSTNIPDDEVEERLLRFFHELRASEGRVAQLVKAPAVIVFFLGCAKYQASKGHRFAPLHDYTPADRLRYERSSRLSSWTLALPKSEAKRLVERYARIHDGRGALRLDAIVLGPGSLDRGLAPDPERFRLSYQNKLFRIYLPATEREAQALFGESAE